MKGKGRAGWLANATFCAGAQDRTAWSSRAGSEHRIELRLEHVLNRPPAHVALGRRAREGPAGDNDDHARVDDALVEVPARVERADAAQDRPPQRVLRAARLRARALRGLDDGDQERVCGEEGVEGGKWRGP